MRPTRLSPPRQYSRCPHRGCTRRPQGDRSRADGRGDRGRSQPQRHAGSSSPPPRSLRTPSGSCPTRRRWTRAHNSRSDSRPGNCEQDHLSNTRCDWYSKCRHPRCNNRGSDNTRVQRPDNNGRPPPADSRPGASRGSRDSLTPRGSKSEDGPGNRHRPSREDSSSADHPCSTARDSRPGHSNWRIRPGSSRGSCCRGSILGGWPGSTLGPNWEDSSAASRPDSTARD